MSELLIPLALAATFGSVALVGIAFNAAAAQRKRTLNLLEAQVAETSNLRQQQLSGSFSDRVLLPFLSQVGVWLRNITPLEWRTKINQKLILAGSPPAWDADKVIAFKVLGIVLGVALSVALSRGASATPARTVGLMLLLGVIFFFSPDAILNRRARERQERIRKALADTMDLLTISVEAGLGFDAALQQVIQHVPGPLSQELGRMLHEVRLGISRVEALRHLAARSDVDELRGFVLAMVQADTFGVSVSKVLRAQATELRTKRRQYAEEKAMKVPVKILFPLIFCVLPALFIIVLGPGAIRIAQNLLGM
jgi:tight adherence protein C